MIMHVTNHVLVIDTKDKAELCMKTLQKYFGQQGATGVAISPTAVARYCLPKAQILCMGTGESLARHARWRAVRPRHSGVARVLTMAFSAAGYNARGTQLHSGVAPVWNKNCSPFQN